MASGGFVRGAANFFGSPTSPVPVVRRPPGFRLVRDGIASAVAVFFVLILVLLHRVRASGLGPAPLLFRPGLPRGRGPVAFVFLACLFWLLL